MKITPITFNGTNIVAIGEGRKTQTRRGMTPQPDLTPELNDDAEAEFYVGDERVHVKPCPYGKPGDLLWVREAWTTHKCFDHIAGSKLTTRSIGYPADGKIETGRYRHARFMPRWASRTTLKLTAVRIERLNEISERDATAEGCGSPITRDCKVPKFIRLWESLHGPGSWAENPYVWVLTFEPIKANVDDVIARGLS